MSLLEKTLDEQYSFESNSFGDAAQTEEALLVCHDFQYWPARVSQSSQLLDQRVASSLVSITRTVMASPQDSTIFNNRGRNALQEKAVLLCGRMASRFIHAGIAVRTNLFLNPYCMLMTQSVCPIISNLENTRCLTGCLMNSPSPRRSTYLFLLRHSYKTTFSTSEILE